MRNQQLYLAFLDFFITMIGAFAICSTSFIAYSNSIPIIGGLYGIAIVMRGFLPLFVHKSWLFKNFPFVHLVFLFLVVTSAILFNNIIIYLVGISISVFLGMFTGSYVYNLEIICAKICRTPQNSLPWLLVLRLSHFLSLLFLLMSLRIKSFSWEFYCL
jgi:hypothetical protein